MGLKHIVLPDLGEGVIEGEILKIKVSKGESVSMDQALVEVMTDKASMEVPSSIEGVIEKVEVKEGDIVPVGTKLFTIQSSSQTEDKNQSSSENNNVENQPEQSKAESIAQAESKKLAETSPKQSPSPQKTKSFTLAIPSTRKLAEELGLSLSDVKGTGSKGEITRQDLLNHIKTQISSQSSVSPRAVSSSTPSTVEFKANSLNLKKDEEDKREALRGLKRLMFENMTLSKATIPHFTVGEQACVEPLTTIKTEMKARLEKQDLKVGYLPFFIKALIPTLKEFPLFNSSYDPETREIVFKKNLNIGFALDSPQGLLVPVLKEAQTKSLLEIIKEVNVMAQQAREGVLEREQLTGAGITITNLGSLGGFYGTPIINPPEMAILGTYKLFYKTVRNLQGDFQEKAFMNFSITCDHRFIDGATAVRFLKSWTARIEEPSLLILD